jgi:hypothetical protein
VTLSSVKCFKKSFLFAYITPRQSITKPVIWITKAKSANGPALVPKKLIQISLYAPSQI